MKTLMTLLVLVASVLTLHLAEVSSAETYTHSDLRKMATQAANRYGVDVRLIFAIIQQESGWKTKVVSSANAIGLMQIWPPTGISFCGLTKKQLYNPTKNLDCGVRYFSQQLKKFNGSVKLALCAYNAGPNRARQGLKRCNRIKETRKYIVNIYGSWCKGKQCKPRSAFPDSAKTIADNWYESAGGSKIWWRLVCEAIDFVYDQKMAKLNPKAVGQSAKKPSQQKIWNHVFNETVNDIHSDEVGTKRWPRSRKTIINDILENCQEEDREVRSRKNSYHQFRTDNRLINCDFTSQSVLWTLVCQAINAVSDNKALLKSKFYVKLQPMASSKAQCKQTAKRAMEQSAFTELNIGKHGVWGVKKGYKAQIKCSNAEKAIAFVVVGAKGKTVMALIEQLQKNFGKGFSVTRDP